jgi:hypothetical protein
MDITVSITKTIFLFRRKHFSERLETAKIYLSNQHKGLVVKSDRLVEGADSISKVQ